MKYLIPLLLICFNINSQNLNVNDEFNYNLIRNSLLKGDSTFDFSLNIRPVSYTQQINKEHKTITAEDSAIAAITFLESIIFFPFLFLPYQSHLF